jgi:hypothetical protein
MEGAFMTGLKELTHFIYGKGFWYADPVKEIDGLTEKHILWVPNPKSLCILWHVGHIAHRERIHIGVFLQGLKGEIIPEQFEIFGKEWCSVDEMRHSIGGSIDDVLTWSEGIRDKSHDYIDSLSPKDFHKIPSTSHKNLTVGHWLFITACHTALHIGRIQMLRAMIEDIHERAC